MINLIKASASLCVLQSVLKKSKSYVDFLYGIHFLFTATCQTPSRSFFLPAAKRLRLG